MNDRGSRKAPGPADAAGLGPVLLVILIVLVGGAVIASVVVVIGNGSVPGWTLLLVAGAALLMIPAYKRGRRIPRQAPADEPSLAYDDSPAGMTHLGLVPAPQQELLNRAWSDVMALMEDGWAVSLERREVFWVNIWQRSGDAGKLPVDSVDELDEWSREMALHYGPDVVLDGYGLIVNPVGSKAQDWHVDYTDDYGTIFIPLTELRPENALQYAILPPDLPESVYRSATENLDAVDLQLLSRAADWVSVRQLLAPPFSMLKMDFGTIHRGVANRGDSHRVLFWISVKRGVDLLPTEPVVQVIATPTQA